MKAWFAIVVCIGIVVHCTSSAYAFHDARSFETPMVEGGGGGQYFSGSPRWKRYDCSVCHVGGQASCASRVCLLSSLTMEFGYPIEAINSLWSWSVKDKGYHRRQTTMVSSSKSLTEKTILFLAS